MPTLPPIWKYEPPQGNAIPSARDFAFDHATGKCLIAQRDLVLTAGVRGPRQAVEIELRTMAGEFYLDETAGLPLLTTLLVKAPNLRAIRQAIRDRILAVDGILEVPKLDLVFDRKARTLKVTFTARTQLDAFSASVVLG